MSEPVSNAEVEDVLASIRRLVSEEKRPAKVSENSVPQSVEEDQAVPEQPSEKLVLTPALRVAEAVQETQEADEAPMAIDAPVEEESSFVSQFREIAEDSEDDGGRTFEFKPLHRAKTGMEEPLLASELAESAEAIELETSAEDPVQDDQPNGFSDGALPDADALSDTWDDQHKVDSDEDLADVTGSETEELANSAEASMESDAFPDEDTVEDGLSGSDTEDNEMAEELSDASVAARENDTKSHEIYDTSTLVQSDLRPGIDVPVSLTSKIAALEAVIGKRTDQWEPDGVDQDPYSGTEDPTIAWEDSASVADDSGSSADVAAEQEDTSPKDISEPSAEFSDATEHVSDSEQDREVAAETQSFQKSAEALGSEANVEHGPPEEQIQEAASDHFDTPRDDAHTDDAKTLLASDVDIMDEEMLRDMVADIVRQELQGALGERVTRNVRKLVRREIHRALAAQDFQ